MLNMQNKTIPLAGNNRLCEGSNVMRQYLRIMALAIGAVLMSIGSAGAGELTAQKCAIAKERATAALFKCHTRAQVKGIKKDLSEPSINALVEACELKHTKKFDRAEARAASKGVECDTPDATVSQDFVRQAMNVNDKSYLLVISADAVWYADSVLALDGVDPNVVWFTDRPAHEAGTADIDAFLQLWGENGTFNLSPPNAALVVKGHEPSVVELLSVEETSSGISFGIKILSGDVPASGGASSLVVDSLTCCTDIDPDGDGCSTDAASCVSNFP